MRAAMTGLLVTLAVTALVLTRNNELSEVQRNWCAANTGAVLVTYDGNGHRAPPSLNWILAVGEYLAGKDEHRPGGQLSDAERKWITEACVEAFTASK